MILSTGREHKRSGSCQLVHEDELTFVSQDGRSSGQQVALGSQISDVGGQGKS